MRTLNWEAKIIGGTPIKIYRVLVAKIDVNNWEDPEVWAAEKLIEWQNTEMGQWIMTNSVEKPAYHNQVNYDTATTTYAITATLKEPDYIIWQLKWGT